LYTVVFGIAIPDAKKPLHLKATSIFGSASLIVMSNVTVKIALRY
tara:strand:+ start:1456 stop:1590 length:135 start_codon:yes stop_codon:yes gene_type:complete